MQAQQAQMQAQMAQAGAKAQIEETQSKTQLNQVKAAGEFVSTQREAVSPIVTPQQQIGG